MKTLIAICCCLAFLGCGSQSSDDAGTTARDTIDGVTGRKAVDAGLKAKEQIQEVSRQKNEDLNEVLGE